MLEEFLIACERYLCGTCLINDNTKCAGLTSRAGCAAAGAARDTAHDALHPIACGIGQGLMEVNGGLSRAGVEDSPSRAGFHIRSRFGKFRISGSCPRDDGRFYWL
jgi:hypothetical protein